MTDPQDIISLLVPQIDELRDRQDHIDTHIKHMVDQYQVLLHEINRLAAFMPPAKKNCPKCGKPVSVRSEVCGCGHRFVAQADPKAGLPGGD